jgi:methanogenic corrinoid protein MtbC1
MTRRARAVVALRPYAIGTAARLAGITPDTLRIWERRYSFIEPSRTEGGHRLYSEEDVQVLRAVKRLVDAGERLGVVAGFGRAVLLARAAEAEERALSSPTAADPYERLIDDVLTAARAFDTARATELLDRPRLLGDPREAIRLLYMPLLRRVGVLWERGELSVGVEHFVEKLVTARLHAVLHATPDGGSGRLALCACPPGERHEAGLIAAAVELRAAGFAVVMLGADTPVDELVLAAAASAPTVLVLAVTTPLRPAVAEAVRHALERPPLTDVPLLLGGPAAQELASGMRRAVVLPASIEAVGPSAQRAAAR